MPFVTAAGRRLAYKWIAVPEPGGAAAAKPVLVFLHEGLGSIRQWRAFPLELVKSTGCAALVYDRYGYGQSDVLQEAKRQVGFMHEEGLTVLPALLKALNIETPILIGHSDGASISLIHAGAGYPLRGVAAMAPHVFIEPVCLDSIKNSRNTFEATDLPEKLGRYHRDARRTFYGWADVWLDPQFERWDIRDEYLPNIRCAVLAIQGHDDEYGTMEQLAAIARRVAGGCELVKLPDCGHSPFRDQPEKTLAAVASFIEKLIK